MSEPGAPYGNEVLEMPLISKSLIEGLKVRFPVPIPELNTPDREIWFHRGAWSVIQFLESTYENQSNVHVGS